MAGGFVKDQDSGLMGQGPGQGDSLDLAPRKSGSPFPHRGFVSHRHLEYFVMNSRNLGRLDYSLKGDPWIIESYALAN
jgi:hypothetical protein